MLAALAVFASVVLAGCVAEPVPPLATGTTEVVLTVDGEKRSYLVTKPSAIEEPAALVLMLHGGFGDSDYSRDTYGWEQLAEREGFVVAYPNGLGRAWSAGDGCCGSPGAQGVDDVAFLTAVVDDVSSRVAIDPSRVFASGMSNGGMMAYRLACETDVLAAVAAVAATILGECDDPVPLSVLHIHGAADESVRLDGRAGTGAENIDGWPVAAIEEFWREVANCRTPVTRAEPPVHTSTAECAAGRDVTLLTVDDAGHQWPGAHYTALQERLGIDRPSTALDATATVWEFFEAHPAP